MTPWIWGCRTASTSSVGPLVASATPPPHSWWPTAPGWCSAPARSPVRRRRGAGPGRHGPGRRPVAGDLADPEAADRLVATALERFGRLDGTVISVGGPPPGPAATVDDDTWRSRLRVRLPRPAAPGPRRPASGDGKAVTFVLSSSVRSPIAGSGHLQRPAPRAGHGRQDPRRRVRRRTARASTSCSRAGSTPTGSASSTHAAATRTPPAPARRGRHPARALRHPGGVRQGDGVRHLARGVIPVRHRHLRRRGRHPRPLRCSPGSGPGARAAARCAGRGPRTAANTSIGVRGCRHG